MLYSAEYYSPIGKITMAADATGIRGLWIEGQKYFLGKIKGEIRDCPDYPLLRQTTEWLDRYFAGKKPDINELSLNPQGSDFAKQVWNILCTIPYGETMTYGEIAAEIARTRGRSRMSAQAVGGAVGHNPISIIVPCHRVIGADGSLTGYAGGIDKKIYLLRHEGADMSSMYVPANGTAL